MSSHTADLAQDLRFAARSLRHTRAFTIVLVSTLALGIGVTSGVYAAIDAVLIRGLPFRDPAKLVQAWETHPSIPELGLSYPDYLDWRHGIPAFSQLAAYTSEGLTRLSLADDGGDPEEVDASLVSDNLLMTLGERPALGRLIDSTDLQPGHDDVALLSDELWRRRYGARANIVGQIIHVGGVPVRVVGVLGVGAHVPEWADLLLPLSRLSEFDRTNRKHHPLEVVGRLRDGATIAEAGLEAKTVAARLAQEYPVTNGPLGARLRTLNAQLVGDFRPPLLLLFGAAALVLLIACGNATALLATRMLDRRGELAVRGAIGATRWRLVRQLLGEALLIAGAAAAVGLIVAEAIVLAFRFRGGGLVGPLVSVNLDLRVVAFAVAVSVLATVGVGLFPALSASRADLFTAMRRSGRGSSSLGTRDWKRNAVVAGEIALALIVVVNAGLLRRSLTQLLDTSPGFESSHLLTFRLALAPDRYPDQKRIDLFFHQLLPKLASMPGASAAGAVNTLPFASSLYDTRFAIAGRPVERPDQLPVAQIRVVSVSYRDAAQIPLRDGRWFDSQDVTGSPLTVVVNQTFVKQFFPTQSVIGARLLFGAQDAQQTPATIVGVVGDVRDINLAESAKPELYFAGYSSPAGVAVRVRGDPASYGAAVRRVVRSLDAMQPIAALRPMTDVMAAAVTRQRTAAALMLLVSSIATLLAAVGLYGTIAYAVTQRRRELAIRLALGATTSRVFGDVVVHSFIIGAVGIVAGLATSAVATRALSSMLFAVSPLDGGTYLGAALVLLSIIAIATAFPAWRASRVDPAQALRAE